MFVLGKHLPFMGGVFYIPEFQFLRILFYDFKNFNNHPANIDDHCHKGSGRGSIS